MKVTCKLCGKEFNFEKKRGTCPKCVSHYQIGSVANIYDSSAPDKISDL